MSAVLVDQWLVECDKEAVERPVHFGPTNAMVCVAPVLPHLLDKYPDQETLRLMMKALFGFLIPLAAIPLWVSFRKYRTLYKKSPSIKFIER